MKNHKKDSLTAGCRAARILYKNQVFAPFAPLRRLLMALEMISDW